MSRSDFRASWGEEVSSPRVGTTLSDYRECSALAIPTPRFSILCLVCRFRYRFPISIQLRRSSFSHGHHSGKCPRRKYSCLPQLARLRASLPTRACTQTHSLKFLNAYIFKFLCMKPRVLFFQLVLFYFPFPKYLNIFRLSHPKRVKTSRLRRLRF